MRASVERDVQNMSLQEPRRERDMQYTLATILEDPKPHTLRKAPVREYNDYGLPQLVRLGRP